MIPFNHLGPLFKYFSGTLYSASVRKALAETLMPLEAESSILDLGAGAGTLAKLAETVRGDLRLSALDPAPGMLRYVPDHIHTTVGSAEAIPFDAASFRAVLVGEALHHFTNPRKSLREIARILKPGGTLFIFDFDPTTLVGGTVCRTERLLGEPANFFPPQRVCRLLERAGFAAAYRSFGWRYVVRAQRLG